ncbi:hypothetical protein Hanom_Chr04g00367411 [Helianthus anomalus]
MARTPARRSHFKINGIPATPHHSEFESEDMEKRFAKMRLSESKKKKKASSPNKGDITVMEELADFVKMSPHSYVPQVPRPPILLGVYEQVKRIADIMDDPNWPNRNLQTDVDQAEYVLMVTCRHFRDFLPTGWRYAREYGSALIAGYGEVYTKDDDDLDYIV